MDDQIPLREDDLLFLRGRREFDPEALAAAVEPLGFEAFVASRFDVVEGEIKRLVREQGISHVWRLVHLQEAVLPKAPGNRPALISLLSSMIAVLAPKHDFIVVDRFLLRGTVPGYIDELAELLQPIASAVAKITLVTTPGDDPTLLAELGNKLAAQSPTCRLEQKTSDEYHDRFWIADRARGLFVGTSLNGIGRRYAIADYLEAEDVAAIVADMETKGLTSPPETHL